MMIGEITGLEPAEAQAERNPRRHPGESADYRAARQELLVAEIELKRFAEQVASMRRALPQGALIEKDYRFVGETGEVQMADLFAGHASLFIYSYMFGPQRQRPCPMCASMMASLSGVIPDIRQQTGIAFVARSPIERLVEWKNKRGWAHMPVFSDPSGEFTRDWVDKDDGDYPALNVFRREKGDIRHFWSEEMSEADPGQDPRSAIELNSLWLVLDALPQGRHPDWRPKLAY